jgi:hypothetical protein
MDDHLSQFPNIAALIEYHAEMLADNPYAYFEIHYSSQDGWEALVGKSGAATRDLSQARATGKGDTPEDAARNALLSTGDRRDWLTRFLEGADSMAEPLPGLKLLFERHAELATQGGLPNAYVEIGYSRYTGWLAWLCSDYVDFNPKRVVLANAGGATADQAALNAAALPIEVSS